MRFEADNLDTRSSRAIARILRQNHPDVGIGKWTNPERLLLIRYRGMQLAVRTLVQVRAQKMPQAGLGLLGRIE